MSKFLIMKHLLSIKKTITILMVSFFMFCFGVLTNFAQNDPVCNQLIETTKTFFTHLKSKSLNIAELDKMTHDEAVVILGNGIIHKPQTASGKRDFSALKSPNAAIVNEVTINNIEAKKFEDNVVSVFGKADINVTKDGKTEVRNLTFSFIYTLKKDGTWHIVQMQYTKNSKD